MDSILLWRDIIPRSHCGCQCGGGGGGGCHCCKRFIRSRKSRWWYSPRQLSLFVVVVVVIVVLDFLGMLWKPMMFVVVVGMVLGPYSGVIQL